MDNAGYKAKVGPSAGETSDREEGLAFKPKFGADGLATCVTVDAARGDVLMVAHMNEAALRATLATGVVHYWSRSRERAVAKGRHVRPNPDAGRIARRLRSGRLSRPR